LSLQQVKGSTRGRSSTEEQRQRGSEWVLKDLDFIEAKRKLNLSPEIKERFTAAVKVDSEFLARSNIIDYSLLVGIHAKPESEDSIEGNTAEEKTNESQHDGSASRNAGAPFLWSGGVESGDGIEVLDRFQLCIGVDFTSMSHACICAQ